MEISSEDNSLVVTENETIQNIDRFVYLGCEVLRYEDIQKEVCIRIGKAGAAFRSMERIWNESGMSLQTKLKLIASIDP